MMSDSNKTKDQSVEGVIARVLDAISWKADPLTRDRFISALESTIANTIDSTQVNFWGEDDEAPEVDYRDLRSNIRSHYDEYYRKQEESLKRERVIKLLSDVLHSVDLRLPEHLLRLFSIDCEASVSDTIDVLEGWHDTSEAPAEEQDKSLHLLMQALKHARGSEALARINERLPSPLPGDMRAYGVHLLLGVQVITAYDRLYGIGQRLQESEILADRMGQTSGLVDPELRFLIELVLWRAKVLSARHTTGEQLRLSERVTSELEEVLNLANTGIADRQEVLELKKRNLRRLIKEFLGDDFYSWVIR